MTLIAKLETELEIKSTVHKFFDAYLNKSHIIPKSCTSDNLHSVEVHHGDFSSSGSLKQWTYNIDGKVQTVKGKIEVDEENKKITTTTLAGEVLTRYKSFKVVLQVIPKEEGGGGLVRWTWEYEKVDESVPHPKKFLDLAINLTKDVDAYTVSQTNSISKLGIEVGIKSSADVFFNTYRVKAHMVPKTASEHLHNVEVHEGDFHSSGSVKQWTYKLDGKLETIKGKIEVDEENKKVVSIAMEGEILKLYKSFKIILQVLPKGHEGGLVKWTWEYEKVKEDVPHPTMFLDLALNLTKDVDAYIINNP